ncbi:MAG: radical SAM family heme chaperone HemW [Planctomycetes bacterium]|nr:radical SAM family heme chaperone HemW [Planctomycetota bacterium]
MRRATEITSAAELFLSREAEFGLYIHTPFCVTKCPYCDFNSYQGLSHHEDEVVDTILRELAMLPKPSKISTVFIGGGTPSMLSEKNIERLFRAVRSATNDEFLREWTVEVNPESVTKPKLDVISNEGATRISVGVQSFNDSHLRLLGRAHSSGKARQALEMISGTKLDLSIDLITCLPGQTVDQALEDAREAMNYPAGHISCYCLTFEEGTKFREDLEAGTIAESSEELALEIMQTVYSEITSNGFSRYEVSNFAKPGKECLHNLGYWTGSDYLGIGPGAASRAGRIRSKTNLHPTEYTIVNLSETGLISEFEILSNEQIAIETIMMGLRLSSGLNMETFRNLTGMDIEEFNGVQIRAAVHKGWISKSANSFKVPANNLHLLDHIISSLTT